MITWKKHDMRDTKLQQYCTYRRRLARDGIQGTAPQLGVHAYYDEAAQKAALFPDFPHYFNVGLWDEATLSATTASEQLIGTLVTGLRTHGSSDISFESARVLDVACGIGGNASYLRRYFDPGNIVGINISEEQLSVCRTVAPQSRFLLMDAVDLAFPEAHFDFLLCVEAAFHFQTRAEFLRQAQRVLKPGGVLALTDILIIEESYEVPHKFLDHHPRDNYLPSLQAYSECVTRAGFASVDVIDITDSGPRSHFRFIVRHLHEEWLAGRVSFGSLQQQLDNFYVLEAILHKGLICFATKASSP